MRNQRSQNNKNQVFDYTNDSFIRKESHLDYVPKSNKKNIDRVLQENFFLKKISSKIVYLLTLQLQDNTLSETQLSKHQEDIQRITNSWKKEINNGDLFDQANDIDHNQIMEVIEWLSGRCLLMKDQVEDLENQLRKCNIEKDKYLKSLESVKINKIGHDPTYDDFDGEFYQRKLNQLKEYTGRLIRYIGD